MTQGEEETSPEDVGMEVTNICNKRQRAEPRGCGWVWVVTRRGNVLHQGADQCLPAGLAQCLGGLNTRKEALCKILFMA